MRKLGLVAVILLFLSLPLFASSSWIGVQSVRWHSEQTATATYEGESYTTSGSDEGEGLIISGSLYLESDYGLGFQFGAMKASEPDPPLSWRGALTTLYGSNISDFFILEFGTGVLYERITDTYTRGGIDFQATVKSFSFYSTTSLVLYFGDYFSFVGGMAIALPLFAQAEITSGGGSIRPEMHIRGFTYEAQIGMAFNL